MRVNIKACNGRWVCAPPGESPLLADRDAPSEWETFELIEAPDAGVVRLRALSSGQAVGLRGEHRELIVGAGDAQFTVVEAGTLAPGVKYDTPVHLRTPDGWYVCAESGGAGSLRADRSSPGGWETFLLSAPRAATAATVATSDEALAQMKEMAARDDARPDPAQLAEEFARRIREKLPSGR